jgi:tripartite-type tricarboxylate transporter receptor subunit TctC
VPTLSEALPGVVSDTWYAIVAPPGTPDQIVERLSSAVAEAIALPDVAERLRDLHASAIGDRPAEAAAFLTIETERWRNVIVSAGITLDR